MKNPMMYQRSDFDCVPSTILNAIGCLVPKDKITPEIIKAIWHYSLDTIGENGEIGKYGTSRLAVQLIGKWFNEYSKAHNLGVKCEFLCGTQLDLNNEYFINHIKNGGVAAVAVDIAEHIHHYLLIIAIDKDYVYLFDCDYTPQKDYVLDSEYDFIDGNAFKANRKITYKRFNEYAYKIYAMGIVENREGLLFYKE